MIPDTLLDYDEDERDVMIRSFAADKETERIWSGLRSRKLPPDIQNEAWTS